MDDAGILREYADRQRERGLARDTLRHYRQVCGAFSVWLRDRGLTLTDCTEADVRAWVFNEAYERTSATHRIYLTRLDVVFRWMADEGYRPDVPTRKLRKPRAPQGVPKPLPRDGLHRALRQADARMGLMLTLAAFAGLRRAEIAGLRWENVLASHEPPMLRVIGKGNKTRFVPIGPVLAAAFEAYGRLEVGPVFPGVNGKCMSRNTVGPMISRHLRACGVDATAHKGRHTFATDLYAASGGDLLIVQGMLGHASVATTQIYAQWSPDKAAEAIGRLPVPETDEAA